MQLKYGFISVDDHVQEVPNLWIDRVEKKSLAAHGRSIYRSIVKFRARAGLL